MFISSIGIESLLGGGMSLALVLGNASSVLVEVFGAKAQSAKKTWPFLITFLIIEDLNHWFKSLYIGVYPIDSPQNISYYWT